MKKYFIIRNYLNFFQRLFLKSQKIYSQTGEDLILNVFLGGQKKGFYLDIGANDPRKFNNTYFFYKKGWRGINIEPNLEKIKLFKNLRKRDQNLNIGLGEREGSVDFYVFVEDTLSTFSSEVADSYEKMGHKLKKVEKIKVFPLSYVFENYVKNEKVDFLSIDTEGRDLEILKSSDWEKYRPKFLIVETLEYKKDNSGKKNNGVFDEYFKNIGYQKIADTYINTIYQDEHARQKTDKKNIA